MALTRKLVSVKIFTSNHFWTQGQRERAQITPSASPTNPEPKSCLRLRRSTNPRIDLRPRAFDPPIYELTNRSSTQNLRPTSLRLRQRSRAFAPRTHEPISLSLSMILIFCVILIDPQTDLRFCVILIFYFLSLISDFFVVVVVVFWWFSYCVMVGFVWVVVENSIFRMLPNT